MSTRVVLGAGVSGLMWLYYHKDYRCLTDQLGRAVTGVDPLIWPGDTPLVRKLFSDLGVPYEVVVKPIGYLVDRLGEEEVVTKRYARLDDLGVVFNKKMFPWKLLESARAMRVTYTTHLPGSTLSGAGDDLTYLRGDLKELFGRMLEETKLQIAEGARVREIWDGQVVVEYDDYQGDVERIKYDRLVSTLPAPTFKKVWGPRDWNPPLHYVPVTFVISKVRPEWWDDAYDMVYDARDRSPVSRVGRFGDQWRYEVTGLVDLVDVADLEPLPEGVFTHPYGRIIQDSRVVPPRENVTFLGRFARWDYLGLIEKELEIVHGV